MASRPDAEMTMIPLLEFGQRNMWPELTDSPQSSRIRQKSILDSPELGPDLVDGPELAENHQGLQESSTPDFPCPSLEDRSEIGQEDSRLLSPNDSRTNLSSHTDQESTKDQLNNVPNGLERELASGFGEHRHHQSSYPARVEIDDEEEFEESRRLNKAWVPYTLKLPYLLAVMIFAMVLCAVVLRLLWYSLKHDGLGQDFDSWSTFFAWKFSPTLVAVIYVLLTSMLLDGVKQTEPFARLAKIPNASGESTVLQQPGSWWNALLDGLGKRKAPSRSWILVFSATLNIIGFAAISPFSSTLLISEETLINIPTHFQRTTTKIPPKIDANDETYFQTIAGFLQNLVTSTWVQNDYAILPFWTSVYDEGFLMLTSAPEILQSTAIVVQTQLECDHLKMKQFSNTSITLNASDGCEIQFTPHVGGFLEDGGGVWGVDTYFRLMDGRYDDVETSITMDQTMTQTKECEHKEILFFTTSMMDTPSVLGYVCSPKYYSANIEVLVNVSMTSVHVNVDNDLFNKSKKPMDPTFFSIDQLNRVFFNSSWEKRLYELYYTKLPVMGGPLVALAALGNFDIEEIMAMPDMIGKLTLLKQRFLGEVLATGFQALRDEDASTVPGVIHLVQRNVKVVIPVAITLASLLFISTILIGLIIFVSRPGRRPLDLYEDPSMPLATARLIMDDENIRSLFKNLDVAMPDQVHNQLKNGRYTLHNGSLMGMPTSTHEKNQTTTLSKKGEWRPFLLRRGSGLGLLLILVTLLATIAALYGISQASGLHQTAFTYKIRPNLYIFNQFSPSIAPYSIIPAIVAVGLGLWWGTIDETYRRLQPFVTMAKRPIPISAMDLSYRSSYLLGAVLKAFRNRHWLLVLICLGAFLCQIFTVAMSALWQTEPASVTSSKSLPMNLKLRDTPFLYTLEVGDDYTPFDPTRLGVLLPLYGSVATNWLYCATVQLTNRQYAQNLPWAYLDWVFTPLDLHSIRDLEIFQDPDEHQDSLPLNSTLLGPQVNVTINTQALRARLECTVIDTRNTETWLTKVDLTDNTIWEVDKNPTNLKSAYELSPNGILVRPGDNSNITTTFFADSARITCCTNGANPNDRQPLSIGYWSYNLYGSDKYQTKSDRMSGFPQNFTVKWLVGFPEPNLYQVKTEQAGHLIWQDPPELTALNCQPVIESADAEIVVDRDTGNIMHYVLTSTPEPYEHAWSDSYEIHKPLVPEQGDDPDSIWGPERNVTVSFGVLFQEALLHAANIGNLNGMASFEEVLGDLPTVENNEQSTFNIRMPGLNVDFPSYSSHVWSQHVTVNRSSVLLDPEILAIYANLTFSKIFQHFALSNISLESGGLVFQSSTEELPAGLGQVYNKNNVGISSYTYPNRTITGPRTVNCKVSIRVEALVMSRVAVVISLVILGYLILTTILVFWVDYKHLHALKGDVDTIAGVIRLLYDSSKLLKWLKEERQTQDQKHVAKTGNIELAKERLHTLARSEDGNVSQGPLVQLGYFTGKSGTQRWGIEIVDQ